MDDLDSEKLDQIIIELDNFLAEGQRKHKSLFADYHSVKELPDFNLDKYYQPRYEIVNNWYHLVANTLDQNFKLKHRVFHFTNPKVPSYAIAGLPRHISGLSTKFESYLYALEDIILWLEERRNLIVRREIAEIEHDDNILYRVRFSWNLREVKLNDMILSTLNSDSKAMNFIEYVYNRPNQMLSVSEIEKDTGLELSNNIHDILRDLGFVGSLKKVFFPKANKSKVYFMNPISRQYAIEQDLPALKIFFNEKQT